MDAPQVVPTHDRRPLERAAFLVEASRLLAELHAPEETLRDLLALVPTTLAAGCAAYLRDPSGGLVRVAWRRGAPGEPVFVDGSPLESVLATGASFHTASADEAALRAFARDEAGLATLLQGGPRGVILVPLACHGRVLGALGLVSGGGDGPVFTTEDLALAEDVGRRAGLAIENARLLQAERAARAGAERALAERDEMMRRLELSEARYRSLAQATTQMVWRSDAGGMVDDLPEWRAYTGQSRDEVRGEGWLDALHPDDRAPTLARWRDAVDSRSVYEAEYRVRSAQGRYRHFAARAVPILDERGAPREWVGTWTDITERVEAEQALRHSELWLRRVYDTLEDAVLVVGYPERRLTRVNRAAERIFGYAADELLGQSTRILHIDDARFAEYGRTIGAAFAEGRPAVFEFDVRRKDGSVVPTEQAVSLLRSDTGEVLGGLCVVRDVSARKEAERELEAARRQVARSERLSALGTLVSGVAHEIRTPLAYLSNHLHLIERRLARAARTSTEASALYEDLHAFADISLEAADRINRLVEDLRRFTREDEGPKSRAPLHLVVRDAVRLFEVTHRGRVQVEADLQPGGIVEVDRSRFQQVVINLLDNGAEAMGGAGRIHVSTRADGGHAELRVRDHGRGVPAEAVARIFDPFFTTKPQGTGLGLSIVKRIVDTHGGRIEHLAPEDGGAEFVVRIPAIAE